MISIKVEQVSVLNKSLRVQHLVVNPISNQPTLVFLHEGLGCVELWKDVPQKIVEATGLNAIVFDRQGYGQSDAMDLPRPLDYLEREGEIFLPALLEVLNIKNPILIGHSDGGTIALVYAAKHPAKAVIAAAAHVLVEPITLEGIRTVVEEYKPLNMEQKLQRYHGEKADTLFWAWADTWLHPEFEAWNVTAVLSDIACPVLGLQGREDEYATDEHLWMITEGIGTHAKGILLDDCAHMPHVQAKEAFLKAVIAFIKEQQQG